MSEQISLRIGNVEIKVKLESDKLTMKCEYNIHNTFSVVITLRKLKKLQLELVTYVDTLKKLFEAIKKADKWHRLELIQLNR